MGEATFDFEATLTACGRGEQHAFLRLYQEESPRMLALALRMLGHRAGAEDLLRDTFILIWKNASSYDPQLSSARAWMYSILRYRALARLRQAGRPASAVQAPITMPPLPPEDDGMGAALRELREADRMPILMAFYDGCHYAQIAQRLQIPVTEAKRRLRHSLEVMGSEAA